MDYNEALGKEAMWQIHNYTVLNKSWKQHPQNSNCTVTLFFSTNKSDQDEQDLVSTVQEVRMNL